MSSPKRHPIFGGLRFLRIILIANVRYHIHSISYGFSCILSLLEKKSKDKEIDSNETPKDEYESILDKVNNIKEIALENNIPEKIVELYRETNSYHAWLYNGNEKYVCSLIEEAKELKLNKNEEEKYYLKLKSGNTFTFILKNTYFFNGEQYGDLEEEQEKQKRIHKLRTDFGIDEEE